MTEEARVIRGIVQDAAGTPVAFARVSFARAPIPLPDIAALTDEEGRFALSAPVPGPYQIQIDSDEAGRAAVEVDVPSSALEAVERLHIDLEPAT